MTTPLYTSVVPRFQRGPVTFQVSTAVLGGMLVQADGGSPAMVQPAGAGSQLVIGVATVDAVPTTESQVPTVPGWPGPVINIDTLPPYTSVAADGVWPCLYAANCSFGDRLKAAANGQVTPWVYGTDNPALIIGICYDNLNVTYVSPGTVGRVRLVGLA
jgi:hypothetical protein